MVRNVLYCDHWGRSPSSLFYKPSPILDRGEGKQCRNFSKIIRSLYIINPKKKLSLTGGESHCWLIDAKMFLFCFSRSRTNWPTLLLKDLNFTTCCIITIKKGRIRYIFIFCFYLNWSLSLTRFSFTWGYWDNREQENCLLSLDFIDRYQTSAIYFCLLYGLVFFHTNRW